MYKKITISIPFKIECVIEPDGDGFMARVSGWPGRLSWGKTFDEAKQNIIDAASLYAECVLKEVGWIVLG